MPGRAHLCRRRHVVANDHRQPCAFVLIAGTELTIMAAAVALAVSLTQTPPPI